MMCNRLATLLSIVREQGYGINIAWLQCCHTRQVHTHHNGKRFTSILVAEARVSSLSSDHPNFMCMHQLYCYV